MADLDGKVFIITGASRGVGRATAHALVERGARVGLLARTAEALEHLARDLGAASGREVALALPADLADAAATRAAVTTAADHFGGLDGIILNAGIGRNGPTESYPLADWRATLEVNLTGAFICAQAALPHLRARGGGAIIAIASGAARQGYPSMAAYCASKFGLLGLMKALGAEFADQRIRCSTIFPGSILTEFGARPVDEKRRSGNKYLTPEDVAAAIVYLLTQPASAWTDEMTLWPYSMPA